MAIDSQVCLHRRLFADPVKPSWCITGPVGPLVSTNQNWLGAKLLSMAVLIHPVVCVHPCRLLRAQHHCLWPNGREGPPSACPPTTPLHSSTIYSLVGCANSVVEIQAKAMVPPWVPLLQLGFHPAPNPPSSKYIPTFPLGSVLGFRRVPPWLPPPTVHNVGQGPREPCGRGSTEPC